MAEAITHPLGFTVVVFAILLLIVAWGAFVKNPFWMRRSLAEEIAEAVVRAQRAENRTLTNSDPSENGFLDD